MVSEGHICFGPRGLQRAGCLFSSPSTGHGCVYSSYSPRIRRVFTYSINRDRIPALERHIPFRSACCLWWHGRPCQTCCFELGNCTWARASFHGDVAEQLSVSLQKA